MRIKELADLTGSTVRTVRYYHQIGLLSVPARRDGVRDYDLTHVARLVRIRWLAQAGIPLGTVADMLAAARTSDGPADMSRHAVVADLRAAVTAVDKQMAELRVQRARIVRLMAGVQRDGQLSPMPAAVSAFYELMRARAADDKTRRLVTAERDFMELAFYRGDMPPESAIVYEGLTEARLADSSALFGRIADRTDRVRSLDDREIESIAAAAVHRISDQLGPRLPDVLRSIDPAVARRAANLYLRLSDPAQRRLDRAIADALLSLIEKGQTE